MKRFIAIGALFLGFYTYGSCAADKMVCLKNTCVQVEIAQTAAARETGLMFRPKLEDNRGMLFIFDAPGRYGFWMKNCRFPLDIIWIDEDRTVVDIKADLQPCQEPCQTFSPAAAARYVLEVNAGSAAKWGIKIGDKVNF